MNTTTATKAGKIFTKVVFLMAQNPCTDMWEPMAYFPDINWDMAGNKTSYMHNGQHGPCCEAFALLDCIAPKKQHLRAVERLKAELESLPEPYVLTVLDSEEWIRSKGQRKVELARNVYEASATGATEKILAAVARSAEARRARRVA